MVDTEGLEFDTNPRDQKLALLSSSIERWQASLETLSIENLKMLEEKLLTIKDIYLKKLQKLGHESLPRLLIDKDKRDESAVIHDVKLLFGELNYIAHSFSEKEVDGLRVVVSSLSLEIS